MNASPQWRAFLGDPALWLHEVEQGAKSADPDKRSASRLLSEFFHGKTITAQELQGAVYMLNGSLAYRLNWDAVEVVA